MSKSVIENTWVPAPWDHLLTLEGDPAYRWAKFYYHHGLLRVEMSPVGPAHAQDNSLIGAIVLACALRRELRLWGLANPTLRRSGLQEAQPDLAYYLGRSPDLPRSNTPLDLAMYGAPVLAIEISATTLADDLEQKRTLYGEMGVAEYWVVNTRSAEVTIFLFEPNNPQGREEPQSRMLNGLSTALLAQALQVGQAEGDPAAARYILGNLPSL